MLMEGGLPNYFTINGRAYPATDTIHMRVGQTVNSGSLVPATTLSTRCMSMEVPSP
jgi:hypothetical protein